MDNLRIDNKTPIRNGMGILAIYNLTYSVVDVIDFWQLSNNQARRLLGSIPVRLWKPLRAKDTLPRVLFETEWYIRMELILWIYQILKIMYCDQNQIDWIKTPNENFDDYAPIDIMSDEEIDGLVFMKDYLIAHNPTVMSPVYCWKRYGED